MTSKNQNSEDTVADAVSTPVGADASAAEPPARPSSHNPAATVAPSAAPAEDDAPVFEVLAPGKIFVIFSTDAQKPETFERVRIRASDKAPRLRHNHATYEHVADDADGTWIFVVTK